MTPPGGNGADKTLGEIVTEVSEKASLLVREEIELAKSEVTAEGQDAGAGAGVGIAAGVFLVFAVVMMLNTFAWLINDALDTSVVWPGFAIVTAILIVLGAIAGLLAKKWLGTGPPTPDLAIEEAKITRETLEHQTIQRDQLERADRARTRRDQHLMASSLPANRSPEQIRSSIEETRRELAFSVNDLRSKVGELTNWRRQLAENREAALVGAAVAGFVIGGGVAATVSLFRRRRG